ncbi:TIGR03826 family flagellar region protein [Bacillaceae bacterium W0354]
MGELANCPNCGKLFVKGVQSVCRECYLEEEEKYAIVYEFLRQKENRQATVLEVSEATGVEEALIMKFVKQRRLLQANFPNLTYPCDRCGKPIREGKMCKSCVEDIREGLTAEARRVLTEEREKEGAYFNINKENKWRN